MGCFTKRDRFFLHVLIISSVSIRKRYLHNIKDVYKLYQGKGKLILQETMCKANARAARLDGLHATEKFTTACSV